MKAIIIEDEKLSAEHLTHLLKKIDASIEVIATFDTVKKSREAFEKGINADVLFVDVHLADGLSFDIFSRIAIETPVIFTTAYDEYAIKAFTVNSVDYLLKPIGIEDLKRAMDKFKKLNLTSQSSAIKKLNENYQSNSTQHKNRFMVKMGDSISSIKTDEISHFVAEDGVVLLVTSAGKKFVIDYTLDSLEELVVADTFFRINRKVIIHINSIQKVNTYFNSRLKLNLASLTDDDCIVSRERVNDFKKWLDK